MRRILVCVTLAVATVSGLTQGTVNFNNRVTSAGLDAPIFDVGGTTKAAEGYAQLVVNGTPLGSNIGDPGITPMKTGAAAGYFGGGSVSVPSVAPGATASIQIRWWKGEVSYDRAAIKCISEAFNVTLGGAGSPPSLPANLVGLKSFTLVPEPSTLALGLLGAGVLLMRRRL